MTPRSAPVEIKLLGGAAIDGVSISRAPAVVLAHLCRHALVHRVTRTRIIEDLWPLDESLDELGRPKDPGHALTIRIGRLKHRLGAALSTTREGLRLRDELVRLDTRALMDASKSVQQAYDGGRWKDTIEAADAFLAEFPYPTLLCEDPAQLDGPDEHSSQLKWLVGWQRELTREVLCVRRYAIQSRVDLGGRDVGDAREHARRLIALDPTQSNYALAMRLELTGGDLERMRVLDDQSEHLRRKRHEPLIDEIKQLRDTPTRRLASPQTLIDGTPGLPPATRCIGRAAELRRLVDAVLGSDPDPVLLRGDEGIGKTALLTDCAQAPGVDDRFGIRRYWVRCEGSVDRAGLVAAIALAIGVDISDSPAHDGSRQAEAWVLDTLGQQSREQPMPVLLVLDGADVPLKSDEHGVAKLIARLGSLPPVVLVCSVQGGVPPEHVPWHRDSFELLPLSEADVRTLFRRARGNDQIDNIELDPLLSNLKGAPLAINVMRAQRWPPRELLGQLAAQRDLSLTAGLDRVFRIAIAELGDASDAKRLLTLMARLPDGVATDDLEKVLPHRGHDAAAGLQDAGLMERRHGSRVWLLKPVRDYVAQHHPLEPEDAIGASSLYRELARSHGPRVGVPGNRSSAIRLLHERANIRWAIEYAFSNDATGAVAETLALTNLAWFAGLAIDDLAQTALDVATDPAHVAELLHARGLSALARSDHASASVDFERALTASYQVPDASVQARCELDLGELALRRFDHDGAREHFCRARELYRRPSLDDRGRLGLANCGLGLGQIELREDQLADARRSFADAHERYGAVEDALGETNCTKGQADVALREGDDEAASRIFQAALAGYRIIGYVLGEAHCARNLGGLALRCRDDDVAADELMRAAQTQYETLDNRLGRANCLLGLGEIALARGDQDTALKQFGAAEPLYGEVKCAAGVDRLRALVRASEGTTPVVPDRTVWLPDDNA